MTIPPWVKAGAVTVGLDFGTHSTKAVLRVRNDARGLVVFADAPTPGYPPYACPSLVRLSGGRLYFGGRAAGLDGGELFRSLKMALLPPDRNGWPDGEFPPETTPDLLVAAYLAWFLGRVREALGESAARVSLNVAAPMSHVEDRRLKDRYLHVVHAAWAAAFGGETAPVTQGVELSAVRAVLLDLLDRPVPGTEHRRFEVQPETLAPLVSLFMDPRTSRGLYLMVDMGAGTTELSVSYVDYRGANATDRTITCFADRSTRLGGDMFAANDRQHARDPRGHAGREAELRARLCDEMRQVWYGGFKKVKDGGLTARKQWRKLTAVLAGGGLLRPGLESAVRGRDPTKCIFTIDPTAYEVVWHQPPGLTFDAAPAGPGSRTVAAHSAYLAVANGLAVERRLWPNFFPPTRVRPFDLPHRADGAFDRRYSDSDVG